MMTAKEMMDLYAQFGLDRDTWDMFREMEYHGLISADIWHEFYDECKGWKFSSIGNDIIVDENDHAVYYFDKEGGLRNFKEERRKKVFDRIENNDEYDSVIFWNNKEIVYTIDYCQAVRSNVLGNRGWITGFDSKKEQFTACVEVL